MRSSFIIFLAMLGIFIMPANAENEKLKIGDKIPEYLGINTDGDKVLTTEHKGKILVVSFWATWCPPCRKELPIIDNLQRLAGKENLSVIAVNFGESGRVFRKFTSRLEGANLTFTHDKKGKIGKNDFGVKGIPHMVIANHKGEIEHIHIGYGDETVNNLANEINALLTKKQQASITRKDIIHSE